MEPMEYGIGRDLPESFERVLARVRETLKAEGFGVLSEIDVQAAMKEKLGVDRTPYVILGACNPPLAHRAVEADRSIGLLLPCNVVVRASGDSGTSTTVEFLDPQVMADVADNPEVKAVADEAGRKLEAALAALTA
jgi:uncharacterized protein (DUF302 family)